MKKLLLPKTNLAGSAVKAISNQANSFKLLKVPKVIKNAEFTMAVDEHMPRQFRR